ncbi:MAG: hemin uptake protein HemP [Pseudomonadota bacterium]
MQTTKQLLRAPFLGQKNNGVTASHASDADAPPRLPRGPAVNIPSALVKTYTSNELFGAGCELAIAHRGERYSLRITSLGKLILTK